MIESLADRVAKVTCTFTPFYSDDSINREFDIIYEGKNPILGDNLFVIMRKSSPMAVIGKHAFRKSDGKAGMEIFETFYFKDQITESKTLELVNGFTFLKRSKRSFIYQSCMYIALVKSGYSLIMK